MTVVDKNMYIVLHLYLLSLMLFNIVKQSAAFQLTIRAGGWWVVAVLSSPPLTAPVSGAGQPWPFHRHSGCRALHHTAATAGVTTIASHSFYPPSSSPHDVCSLQPGSSVANEKWQGRPAWATVTAVVYAVVSCDPPLETRVLSVL